MDINLIRKLGIYLMLCKNILCSFNNTVQLKNISMKKNNLYHIC